MSLVRFAPRLSTFWPDFDDLFRDFAPTQNGNAELKTFAPPADIAETQAQLEVHLDLPGFKGDDIDVKVEDDVLTISAQRSVEKTEEKKGWLRQERGFGRFVRSFTLPNTVDGSKLAAAYKNGVLTVTLPKRAEAQPRSVKVKVEA
jgi:HSP20 family protein